MPGRGEVGGRVTCTRARWQPAAAAGRNVCHSTLASAAVSLFPTLARAAAETPAPLLKRTRRAATQGSPPRDTRHRPRTQAAPHARSPTSTRQGTTRVRGVRSARQTRARNGHGQVRSGQARGPRHGGASMCRGTGTLPGRPPTCPGGSKRVPHLCQSRRGLRAPRFIIC